MLKQIINQEQKDEAAKQDGQPQQSPSNNPTPAPKPSSSPRMSGSGKNILSSDVTIKGNLKFTNDLIMDGRLVEGAVISDGDLTVGENATIDGQIKTRSVTVFGKVNGNITVTDRCELKQNAELHGDVTAGKLAIEEGATFMGTSTVGAAASSVNKSSSAPSSPQKEEEKPKENEGGGQDQENKHQG